MERAEAYRIHIEWALGQPGINGKPISFNGAAETLNKLQIPSPRGGRWSSMNVADIAVRLKLREKSIRVPREVLQERVDAIWKAHPDCTGQQVLEALKPEHTMCLARAWGFLRNCRRSAAQRSAVQRQMGWRIDHRTATRIRISSIWKRHPEFTAQQAIKQLGPRHSVSVQFVQQVMRECWRAAAKPKQRRKGRRFLHSWRARHRGATKA
jgi:hypothetical protein